MQKAKVWGVFLTLLVSFAACDTGTTNPSSQFTLTLLHLNDTHGQLESYQKSVNAFPATGNKYYFEFGGQAGVTEVVEAIRAQKQNVLLLHAGDAFNGSLYSIEFHGMADLAMLKAMEIDAMCLGNHEFDEGPAVLQNFVNEAINGGTNGGSVGSYTFPILCANVDASTEPELDGDMIEPYVIMNVNGRQVGIVSVVFEETAGISSPGPNLQFEEEIANCQAAVDALQASNVNIIIALTHIGFDRDQILAENVDGIDVIIGGHTHSFFGDFSDYGISSSETEYPYVLQRTDGREVLIVSAGKWAWVLGQLDVTFNTAGDIVRYSGSPQLIVSPVFLDENKSGLDTIESNIIANWIINDANATIAGGTTEALSVLEPYRAHVESVGTNVVAQASSEIFHRYYPSGGESSELGPVIAESYLWKITNGTANPESNANFCIMNSGGVRANIEEGDDTDTTDGTPPITITVNKVFQVSPFGNTIVIIDVTAAELYSIIEDCCDTPGGFPNIAGMTVVVTDTETSPNGTPNDSVTCNSITWLHPDGSSELLDRSDTTTYYKLIMNSFSAAGGDFYDTVAAIPDTRKIDTGFVDGQVVMEYYQHLDSLSRMVEPLPMLDRFTYNH